MSSSEPTISEIQRSIRDAVRLHWSIFLLQGVIFIVLGVLAVIWPYISTVAADVYIGALFLIAGVAGLVLMIYAPGVASFVWALLTSVLALFVGLLLLWHPVEGAVPITLVLIAFFIVEGIFQIAASIGYRDVFPDSWGWMLASGIAELVLAALIIAGWPGTAGWALGLIVGVSLIVSGLTILIVATKARQEVKKVLG